MKTQNMRRSPRQSRPRIAHPGERPHGGPRVAVRAPATGPTRCERCGAVYHRRVWRTPDPRQPLPLAGVRWSVCPACRQVADTEYFGRLRVTEPLTAGGETEVRRRVRSVETRARHTQPERRVVNLGVDTGALEVLTTSQKLAHRIARELIKAFGGRARYAWSDQDGSLEVTWTPPAALCRERMT